MSNHDTSPSDPGRASDSAARETIPPPSSGQRETILPGSHDSVAENAARGGPPDPAFGRYQLIECLGQGGMGAVYKAHDSQLDRVVAIKIPKFDTAAGPDLLERFYREARSAATLTHVGICPVHDVGEIDGTHYISMGYIEGKPLSAYIKPDKPISAKKTAAIVRRMAVALDEAHQHGVVHRDLKPDNVMIDKKSNPVVMDFGLARRSAAEGDSRMTQGGQMIGTPAYMSPEQVDGDVKLMGPRSDIYSLGVILYEMLTCRVPYEGSIARVLAQVIHGNPQRPSELRPDVNPGLEAICLKMMASSPDDRHASMGDVVKDLAAFLKGQPTSAKESVLGEPAPMIAAESVSPEPPPLVTTSPAQPSRRPNLPKWAMPAGAGVLGIVLIAALTLIVRVGDATVRLQIDDTDATVFVDGDQVRIENLGATIELSPGDHGVKVKRGDIVVHAETFTVLRDNNPVLTLQVLKDTAPPADQAPATVSTTGQPDSPPSVPVTNAVVLKTRDVIQQLAAKRIPEGIGEGVTVFPGARGNGRVGAWCLYVPLESTEIANGTEWQFEFRTGGSSRGLHIIHPWRDGQLVVFMYRDRIAVNPVGEKRDNYLLQSRHPVEQTPAWNDTFPLKSGSPYQVKSRLYPDGRYVLEMNGEVVATSSIDTVTPFKLNEKFNHAKALREWQPGMAGLMVGPRDSAGVNSVTGVKLTGPANTRP